MLSIESGNALTQPDLDYLSCSRAHRVCPPGRFWACNRRGVDIGESVTDCPGREVHEGRADVIERLGRYFHGREHWSFRMLGMAELSL